MFNGRAISTGQKKRLIVEMMGPVAHTPSLNHSIFFNPSEYVITYLEQAIRELSRRMQRNPHPHNIRDKRGDEYARQWCHNIPLLRKQKQARAEVSLHI
jgi:hypothetical protein